MLSSTWNTPQTYPSGSISPIKSYSFCSKYLYYGIVGEPFLSKLYWFLQRPKWKLFFNPNVIYSFILAVISQQRLTLLSNVIIIYFEGKGFLKDKVRPHFLNPHCISEIQALQIPIMSSLLDTKGRDFVLISTWIF